ncbi:AsmA-like C-terminal region [Malonomonas rubra DSM 5091]|uniref:AsmA-like C-terminal region n=1 Tax=Malonomonas rubra DSM 5091 TaxID=1122189 RepID=A0A1M6MX26_MALRU|nr:AsmA-like C-terminal domain-containing protein [Malonomonas rubra]SHJ88027.1 AsmA-like C-terminal region [Malonomonas rubra DSM 5091]
MTAKLTKFITRALLALFVLLAVLVCGAVIFLSQLELDDYRHQLEQELSLALEQPVSIGSSKLAFEKGIALQFNQLRIGPKDALLADVANVTATLKLEPLFDGRIILDHVLVDQPKLQIWLPIQNRPERGTTHSLTDKLGISVLTIQGAELSIHKKDDESSEELLKLYNLFTVLHGWQPGKTANLTISGKLRQAETDADLLLNVTLPTSPDPAIWRQEEFNHKLRLSNLDIGRWLPNHGETRPVDLAASVSGIPADGANIFARLTDINGGSEHFRLSGRWLSLAEQEKISELSGSLFDIPLSGECYLLRQQEQQYLAGRFGARNFRLSSELLQRLSVPDADKFVAGQLERLELIVEKQWPVGEKMKGLPRIGAEIALTDFEWQGNRPGRIDDFTAAINLIDDKLTVNDGLLVSSNQPIYFSGSIAQLFVKPQLDLKVNTEVWLDDLQQQTELPQNWKLAGALTAALQLRGPLQHPNFELRSNLAASELDLGQLLQKHAGQQGQLLLRGELNKELLQLDLLELTLADFKLSGNGCFDHDPQSDFFLLDIEAIDLSELRPLSPLLNKLELQGKLHPTIERSESGVQLSLEVKNVGAHLTSVVGDLRNTSGLVEIDEEGMSFANLLADFGESTFTLSGGIADWQQPQLAFDLSSPQVRAHDLIFHNQQLQLYDLSGRLKFDAEGIIFDQIKVRVEEETEAIVNGKMDSFSNPQVLLDIVAEKANIDQIIALFIGPHKSQGHKPRPDSRPLLITVSAKKGNIGDLQFTNASGLIKDHHRVFTIFPLNFESGQGSCQARVELDRNREEGLLKVSGHALDIDATILHQDLFKERGLINGPLSGNFYLEGSLAGKGFWPNAKGAIHMQVKNGVLRKFSSLAKVFSLLNVSQLFAGKLPDIDKEGMPFKLLEGTVKIHEGRAYTEDMRVISEAMNLSMVGSQNLLDGTLDYQLGVMPLRTVDKVISSIPLAGWVLTGENKALFTAHFKIEGPGDKPKVTAVPVDTVSDTVFGIFKRTVGLPGKLVKDIGSLFKNESKKKEEPEAGN